MDSLTTILDTSNESLNSTSFDAHWIKNQLVSFLQEEISLIWIIFGTIGNLLSLLVLCRRKMRIHSTFTYLTLLALCDTLVLYFGLLRDFLVNKYRFDIDGDLFCKFHVFTFYFMLHMASWLLVAVNIDRLIAASFLSLSKKWCTPKTALTVSLWLAVTLALLNSHFIYFVDSNTKTTTITTKQPLTNNNSENNKNDLKSNLTIEKNNNYLMYSLSGDLNNDNKNDDSKHIAVNQYVYRQCFIKHNYPTYKYFFSNVFTWIDASAQVILPFAIMVICNVNIIHKVLLTKNKTNGKNLKRLRKIKGMCIMIVSVSVIFFVLEAPVLIFICLEQGELIQSNWPFIDLVWTIMNLMMYTNHVINFFSYCMTGTKFRRELLRLLCVHQILKCLSSYKTFNLLPETGKNFTNLPIKNLITKSKDNKNIFVLKNNNNVNNANNNNNNNLNVDNLELSCNGICKVVGRMKSKETDMGSNFNDDGLLKCEQSHMVSLTSLIVEKKLQLGVSTLSLSQQKKVGDEDDDVTNRRRQQKAKKTLRRNKRDKKIEVNVGLNEASSTLICNDKSTIGSAKFFGQEFYKRKKRLFKQSREISVYINKKSKNDDMDIEIDDEDEDI